MYNYEYINKKYKFVNEILYICQKIKSNVRNMK